MKPFIYAHVLSDNTGSIYLGCDDKSAVEASAELEGCAAEVIELYKYSDIEKLQDEIDVLRDALKDVLDWIDASSSRTALENIVKQALDK